MSDQPEGSPLPTRIMDLGIKLQRHPDREVADDVRELLRLVDDFHRGGLTELVRMIQAWRGETFLDAVSRSERPAALLRAYGLPPATPP